MPESLAVSAADVQAAAQRIAGGVSHTDLSLAESLSAKLGAALYLKHEHRQRTGSFKERGARNALKLLDADQARRGVVAASAGNHALALARHGKLLGIPVTVVMPRFAPMIKVERCRYYGAKVVQHGEHLLEAKDKADQLAAAEGLRYINGYDDPAIIAGAGTVALEMLGARPELDVLVVPIGGGGLIAGMALVAKHLNPGVRVVGVEPANAASYSAALAAGRPVKAEMRPTLADGLSVATVGSNAFAICRRLVDEVVLVGEEEVALAILRLVELEKAVVEGAGAAGLAAVLAGKVAGIAGKNVGIPLCGGNIDSNMLGRIIQRGLAVDGRLCRFSAHISDRPGGLAMFARTLADEGASIVDITHDRVFGGDEVANVSVLCTVETRNAEHIAALKARLDAAGFGTNFHKLIR